MLDFSPRQWLALIWLFGLLVFTGGMLLSHLDATTRAEAANTVAAASNNEAYGAQAVDGWAGNDASSLPSEAADVGTDDGVETATVEASLDDCVAKIDGVARDLGAMPETIASDATMHIARFHTVDGSVLVTCSAADGRMAITKSSN